MFAFRRRRCARVVNFQQTRDEVMELKNGSKTKTQQRKHDKLIETPFGSRLFVLVSHDIHLPVARGRHKHFVFPALGSGCAASFRNPSVNLPHLVPLLAHLYGKR